MGQSVPVSVAAKAMGVSRVTVYAMIDRGELLGMGKPKRVFVDDLVRLKVPLEAIEAAIKAKVRAMRIRKMEHVNTGLAHERAYNG